MNDLIKYGSPAIIYRVERSRGANIKGEQRFVVSETRKQEKETDY